MSFDRDLLSNALPAYDIGDELGQGGMGVVVSGQHRQLGRRVAIKQLPAHFAADSAVRRRFTPEARVLASLDHPHVVPVYDFVERDGICLLVMELLPGGTLRDRMDAAGEFTAPRAVAVSLACLSGLAAAHQRGVLHRDVKPENMLFSASGVLKVADFGIAKVLGGPGTVLTRRGDMIGTPAYMAPEQILGDQLTPATDVYAVATMLYELLAGVLPFTFPDDAADMALLFKHAYEKPIPLRDAAPAVPDPLAQAVMHALATEPADRFATAESFGAALAEAATQAWGDGWLPAAQVPLMDTEPIIGAAARSTASSRTASSRTAPTVVPAEAASASTPSNAINVFLADDNLIVREGVRALIERNADLKVVGAAADYDEVVSGCTATEPQVLVTDVRMPPSYHREGIDAAKEVRKRYPGTGVVVLSQYDDPEYAVSLLAEGSAGYGYLLKDRVAEGNQLAEAIRSVATGGTALDPAVVESLIRPVVSPGGLLPAEEDLLEMVAEGKPIKAIAAARRVPPEAIDAEVKAVFVKLAEGVSAGDQAALNRLRLLHQAIVDREEQGETLSRLLPQGLAEKLRAGTQRIGETERVIVTVLMSDIRSYSTIAEYADPSQLARQLNVHRAAMNRAILGEGGTVMQFVGDAVMAVFGAPFPQPDHPDRAVAAAAGMHSLQTEINARWQADGLPPFGLGIGLSTGEAAAALLGSEDRLEYTIVGDTVNLAQRLQQLAAVGETVLAQATRNALTVPTETTALPAQLVKGRATPVVAHKIAASAPSGLPSLPDDPLTT